MDAGRHTSRALPLHRLAKQRLGRGEVALVLQQPAEVVDGGERARVPIAELAVRFKRLAVQQLGLIVLALVVQLYSELVQSEGYVLSTRPFGL